MAKTIWKFPLAFADEQVVEMPMGAQILCLQMQGRLPQLWAMVDPSAARERSLIRIYGTGHPVVDEPGQYLGTFQLPHHGALVFHAFREVIQ